MARKEDRKYDALDLYILFEVMKPSEITKVFPEYGSSAVRISYMRWKEAKERVMRKLTLDELAKRMIFGTRRE